MKEQAAGTYAAYFAGVVGHEGEIDGDGGD